MILMYIFCIIGKRERGRERGLRGKHLDKQICHEDPSGEKKAVNTQHGHILFVDSQVASHEILEDKEVQCAELGTAEHFWPIYLGQMNQGLPY